MGVSPGAGGLASAAAAGLRGREIGAGAAGGVSTSAAAAGATLRGRGVGPDIRVGLCVERSPEMIIALLGILKAGGAYVPLDPAYPQVRLEFMLKDADAPLLLIY